MVAGLLATALVIVVVGSIGGGDARGRDLPEVARRPAPPVEEPDLGELSAPLDTPVLVVHEVEGAGEGTATWPVRRLHGRVLERGTDEPIDDAVVRIAPRTGEPATSVTGARSDAAGLFEATYEGPDEAIAAAMSKHGFIPDAPPLRLSEGQLEGRDEVVLYLRRGASGVVSGQVVDDQRGLGVRGLRVHVTHQSLGVDETVETDDGGGFATEVVFPEGHLTASIVDPAPEGDQRIGRFETEHLEGGKLSPPWSIEVAMGPSFDVVGSGGPPLDATFTIQLTPESKEPEVAATLEVSGDYVWLARPQRRQLAALGYASDEDDGTAPTNAEQAEDESGWPALVVRAGSPPFVRYPRQLEQPKDGVTYQLVARSGASWVGEAPVHSIVGPHPGVVGIPLRVTASVSGRVLETTDAPVADARVALVPPGEPDAAPLHQTTTDATGAYAFQDVEVRRWLVVVTPNVHAGDSVEIELRPGTNAVATTFVPPAPIAGPVSGELIVPPDVAHDQPVLSLFSREGSSWMETTSARRLGSVAGGEVRYAFSFDEVPSGEYELIVGVIGQGRSPAASSWSPRRHVVYPPRGDIRFRCTASTEETRFAFDPRDEKGVPVGAATVRFGPEGYLRGTFDVRPDLVMTAPADAKIQWRVTSRGRASVSGDERDLRSTRDTVAAVEVTMREGFSALLHLVAAKEGRRRGRDLTESIQYGWDVLPLRDAKVYADDQFVGRPDANGTIELSLRKAPSKIVVRADGWRGVDASQLRNRRGWSDEYVVSFERTR